MPWDRDPGREAGRPHEACEAIGTAEDAGRIERDTEDRHKSADGNLRKSGSNGEWGCGLLLRAFLDAGRSPACVFLLI